MHPEKRFSTWRMDKLFPGPNFRVYKKPCHLVSQENKKNIIAGQFQNNDVEAMLFYVDCVELNGMSFKFLAMAGC